MNSNEMIADDSSYIIMNEEGCQKCAKLDKEVISTNVSCYDGFISRCYEGHHKCEGSILYQIEKNNNLYIISKVNYCKSHRDQNKCKVCLKLIERKNYIKCRKCSIKYFRPQSYKSNISRCPDCNYQICVDCQRTFLLFPQYRCIYGDKKYYSVYRSSFFSYFTIMAKILFLPIFMLMNFFIVTYDEARNRSWVLIALKKKLGPYFYVLFLPILLFWLILGFFYTIFVGVPKGLYRAIYLFYYSFKKI